MKYALTCAKCDCVHPVETRQAGGSIVCSCGETIAVPTMMKIKRLPEWTDAQEKDSRPEESNAQVQETVDATTKAQEATQETNQNVESTIKKKTGMSGKRLGLFLASGLFFVLSAMVLGCNINRQPDPRDVFYKQVTYRLDGDRQIRRDSSPITTEDYAFYFLLDPERPYVVTDELIDVFSDFYAVQYFDYVKELDLSDNFYDNFESIKTRWRIRIVGFSVFALIMLVIAMYALFAKESTKQVGAMRGEGWR